MYKSLLLATVAVIAPSCAALAGPLSPEQRSEISASIDAYAPRMYEVSDTIWAHPELGYLETATADLLQSELKAHGFTVETGVAGIPTAFIAKSGTEDGPVIAIMAEMDALPGFSQSASPEKHEQDGLDAGHACGHHMFGAGSVAAAIAVSDWLKATGTNGQVRLYGTPAEEGGSGKAYLVRGGLFDDVDITLHWHPSASNSAEQGKSLANISAKFRFSGISAHAALAPDKGRSALDGIEAMNMMVNLMREHVPQETRIHYVITDGGKAPNVVPDFAESYLYVRHPDPAVVADVFSRIEKAAEGAALGTGTTYEVERVGGAYSLLPNDTLGKIMDQNLRQSEPIAWTAEETDFATKLQTSLKKAPPLTSVSEVDAYSFGDQGYYSTDVGDVSWVTPTAGLGTATWVPGTWAHSWQAVAAGGMSIGHKGTRLAAETLATTAAELFQSPDVIAAAKAEFEEGRGSDFKYSAMIGDRTPPLDYRLSAAN
ncbi:amidohydrolase [Roseibium suaedae]|uniref:Aminobenzoyl-glutamate utilization protein B n=1 Tax=Roseibium suaedae TaxID=735517 RepID=A0A1M7N6I7_9HYPH|nr:amidohydrolase [Roseibium suaedae]SHM99067.1 aminobenzoyl-glutamate utilization protein B [Roseibium suaedae]